MRAKIILRSDFEAKRGRLYRSEKFYKKFSELPIKVGGSVAIKRASTHPIHNSRYGVGNYSAERSEAADFA